MGTNNLAYYRYKAGLTLAQLSDRSGVSLMQISKTERGVQKIGNITLKNAYALAEVLGIHTEQLLVGNPEESIDSTKKSKAMEQLTEKEMILLRQMVDEYIKVLEALPEGQLDDYAEQLQLCLGLQRKFDNGSDGPECV